MFIDTKEYTRDILDINEIIIVVGNQRQSIMGYFKNRKKMSLGVYYVVQHTSQARSLAATTSLSKDQISNGFVLFLGDNSFGANLKK